MIHCSQVLVRIIDTETGEETVVQADGDLTAACVVGPDNATTKRAAADILMALGAVVRNASARQKLARRSRGNMQP